MKLKMNKSYKRREREMERNRKEEWKGKKSQT
jgi:hypothetical protein